MRGAVKPSPSPLGLSLAGLPKIMPRTRPLATRSPPCPLRVAFSIVHSRCFTFVKGRPCASRRGRGRREARCLPSRSRRSREKSRREAGDDSVRTPWCGLEKYTARRQKAPV